MVWLYNDDDSQEKIILWIHESLKFDFFPTLVILVDIFFRMFNMLCFFHTSGPSLSRRPTSAKLPGGVHSVTGGVSRTPP